MLPVNEGLLNQLRRDVDVSNKNIGTLLDDRRRLKQDFNSTNDTRHKNVFLVDVKKVRDTTKLMKDVIDATVPLAEDYMPYVAVPDVVGMTEATAITTITDALFVAPAVEYRTDAGTAGIVLEVSPVAGTPFARSKQITIIVSQA